jgi:hypothetical protein
VWENLMTIYYRNRFGNDYHPCTFTTSQARSENI